MEGLMDVVVLKDSFFEDKTGKKKINQSKEIFIRLFFLFNFKLNKHLNNLSIINNEYRLYLYN